MFPLTRRSRGCLKFLNKVSSLVAAVLVCGATAYAAAPSGGVEPIQFPRTSVCASAISPPRDTEQTGGNQYLLLLFFENSAAPAVNTLLNTTPVAGVNVDGCWPNPDYEGDKGKANDPPALLRVQGSCPTDCVTPPKLEVTTRANTSGPYHDPLREINGNPGWGLFFADRKGTSDTSNDDPDTDFVVWQILVADAGHAGRVLKSLEGSAPSLFTTRGGYLGHLMIGYRPISSVAQQHK
jgi:hypothetical protein